VTPVLFLRSLRRLARGRVMMYPLSVVSPRPRSGEAVTSPKAEAEVGRGRDLLPRPGLRPRPGVGRGGDLLPRPRLRPRPGVGRGGAPYCARGRTQERP
jgi:hypothetical protein